MLPVRLRDLQRFPSAILLAVQLITLMLYPLFENIDGGRAGLSIVGVVVLAATLRMIRRTGFRTWVAWLLGAPASILLLLQAVADLPQLLAWSSALEAVLYFYASALLIRYMIDDRRATPDELFAAAGTFTLIAWAFAYLFMTVQLLAPGSFSAAVNPEQPRSWTELMFLSFALLSSTGIGDIIPIRPAARGLASLEMMVGVGYLAAVVARLIALLKTDRE